MYRGNFDVNDRVSERFALRLSSADGETLTFTHPDMQGELTVRITRDGGLLRLCGECGDASINRIWLRLCAEEGEHVTGGGEQFSALDMRGRLFPIWNARAGRRPQQTDRDNPPCQCKRRRRRRLPYHILPPADLRFLPHVLGAS